MKKKKALEILQSDETFELSAQRLNHRPMQSIGIFGDIYSRRSDGAVYIAEPLVFVEQKKRFVQNDPMCTIDDQQAQTLMNSLWECGIRPVQGAGSAGQLTAVQYHLEDMRKLVFTEGELK